MCGGGGSQGNGGDSDSRSYVDRLTRTIESNLARNNAGPVSGGSLYGGGGADRDRQGSGSSGGGGSVGGGGGNSDNIRDSGRSYNYVSTPAPVPRNEAQGSGMGRGGEDVGRLIGGGGIGSVLTPNVSGGGTGINYAPVGQPGPTFNQMQRNAAIDQASLAVNPMVGGESGFKVNAQNPTSSASGLGQFIDSTWTSMITKYRPDLLEGRTPEEVLALKTDPNFNNDQETLSLDMTEEYAKENALNLLNKGQPVNTGTIYLSHFLGPDTAVNVLKANPDEPISKYVSPNAIDKNQSILGGGKTTGEVARWAEDYMNKQAGTLSKKDPSFIDNVVDYGKKLFTGDPTDNRSFGDKALDYGINTAVGVASPPLGLASLVSSIFGGPTPASLLRKGLTSASSDAQKEFNRDKQMTSEEVDLASRSTYGPYGNLTRDQYREQYGNGGGADRPQKKKAATEPVAPVAATTPAAIPTIVPQSTTTPVAPGTTPNTRKLSDEEYAALSPLEKAYYDMGISTYGTFTPEYNYFPNRQPILLREPVIAPDEKNKKRNGGLVKGPGTETSDSVPALIGGKTPAALSDGEFVFTGRAVRGMGNGDRMEGARKLHQMMKKAEGNASKGGPRK